jgi:hypothetical protein
MTGRNVTECRVVSSDVVGIPHAQGAYMDDESMNGRAW